MAILKWAGGILLGLLFFAYGLLQIAIAWWGIEHYVGKWWSIPIMLAVLFLRMSFIASAAVFMVAISPWGFNWPWWVALIFVAPGLLLIVPGAIAAGTSWLRDRVRSKSRSDVEVVEQAMARSSGLAGDRSVRKGN
jgi:hypothetical protein